MPPPRAPFPFSLLLSLFARLGARATPACGTPTRSSMKPSARLLLALGLFIILIQSRATTEAEDDDCQTECGAHARQENPCGEDACICLSGFQLKTRRTGFRNASENSCEDIDECKKNTSICEPNGSCINIKGDYHCVCKPGFAKSQKDDKKLCRDINECDNPNQCDEHANCFNSAGSYSCTCLPGYFQYTDVVHGGENRTKCKELTCPTPSSVECSDGQALLCDFITQLGSLCSSSLTIKHTQPQEQLDVENLLQDLMNLLDKVVSQLKAESKEKRHHTATQMMEMVEAFLRVLAFGLHNRTTSLRSSSGIELDIEIRTNGSQSPARLMQEETQMELDWEAASKEEEAFHLVSLLSYHSLGPILTEADVKGKEWEQVGKSPEWAEMAGKPNYEVLSRVASAVADHTKTMSLRAPVTFNFSHREPDSKRDRKVICAFWEPVNGSGRWSEEGCTRLNSSTATSTHCRCDHMTSFAVLMAFYDVEDRGLELITKIGLVVSLVCLFFSILTFLFCRAIRGIRTTIHLHLCLTLFAGYVTFLMGAGNPSNMTACAVVAGLLHYFFLSVFCWMLLEGVELYLMVVQVFKTHSLKHWHIFLVGYGLPAIVVGISAAANSKGYGNKHCWLAKDNGFLWSFLAPVAFIIVVNAMVFVVTVWKLSEKFADINPDMSRLKKQRVLTITAIAQLCILGVTWIFGLFQFSDHTLVMSYLFTICNSLQGLFIFLLHCVLKKQVRDEYYRWFCKGRPGKGHSSDKYSDLSSTAGSNTLRANKSFRESGI